MNEILRQLYGRKSVRVYTDAPITAAEKEAILTAACAAPTAGNQQLYTILDIQNNALKAKLADLCDHQSFINAAPMVLVFCADCKKWPDAYRMAGCTPRPAGVGDLLLAVSDANIAAQNAVTAAESLGIGSCYIGDVMENVEAMRALLQLPAGVFPAAMLVFGHPTAQQQARPKPLRAPLDSIVQTDTYTARSEAELTHMLENEPFGRDLSTWLTAFCKRKYESDFAREMTRSVGVYLEEYDR